MQRKLTVILSAGVAAFDEMIARDEAGTLTRIKQLRDTLIEPGVERHGGRIFKWMGDGLMAEFPSATSAVACALELQRASPPDLADQQAMSPIRLRIGVNLGDVIVEGADIYGDGVNVAARLHALAAPGGIALSRNVIDQVAGKVACSFDDMGAHSVKNIAKPVQVFAARLDTSAQSHASAQPAQRAAICVLPFTNMSGESEQDYFADGITEDIITDLSKVSSLWVAARSTTFAYKGQATDPAAIARQLDVSHVLGGSVRKSGGRVRITAQLADRAGGHVWADRYDRELKDIFALQDEISQAIVRALKVKLLPDEQAAIRRRGTENVDAYKLYVQARQHLMSGRTHERFYRAVVRMSQRAVELDPQFADAWSTLGRAQERLRFDCNRHEEDGTAAVERALALNARLAEAHAAMATIQARRGQLEAAERSADIALALDPDSFEVNAARASVHFRQGQLAAAAQYYQYAAELNPVGFQYSGMVLSCARAVGAHDQASHAARTTVARCEAALAREMDNCDAIGWLVNALGHLGQMERVREWISRALMYDPDNLTMRYNFACTFAQAGATDDALDMLDAAMKASPDTLLGWIKPDPDMNPLRASPRFQALVARAEAAVATCQAPGSFAKP